MTEAQIRDLIRQELANLLAPLLPQGDQSRPQFLPPRRALQLMRTRTTSANLRRHIQSGYFRSGREYVDVSQAGASRPSYRFDPDACDRRLAIPAEQRQVG